MARDPTAPNTTCWRVVHVDPLDYIVTTPPHWGLGGSLGFEKSTIFEAQESQSTPADWAAWPRIAHRRRVSVRNQLRRSLWRPKDPGALRQGPCWTRSFKLDTPAERSTWWLVADGSGVLPTSHHMMSTKTRVGSVPLRTFTSSASWLSSLALAALR